MPKYSFRRVKPAEPPTAKNLRGLIRHDTASGGKQPRLKPTTGFLELEKKSAVIEKHLPGIRVPKWYYARRTRGASLNAVWNEMLKRLRRAPSESNLRLAQYLLNEQGRRRGGGKFVHRTVTQKLVDEFQAKE
jgi:hypothetical protein